ncbi:MAG: SGNH/GDSL hydrolase family protein [Candidatus Nanohalobium sp.]
MQIFAFGHSITYGLWDRENGWVLRLRKFLDQKSLENPDEYYFEVYNLGVSGNDSRQLLERFSQELEARLWDEDETLVLIQIGANDIHYLEEKDGIRVEKEEYRESLEALIEEAGNYTDKIVLVGEAYTGIEGPIPWSEDKHLSDERLGEYVEVQREVAEQEDVPYVDVRGLREKHEWLEMLEDGSHPDSEGHELIYRNVKEKLVEKGLLGL